MLHTLPIKSQSDERSKHTLAGDLGVGQSFFAETVWGAMSRGLASVGSRGGRRWLAADGEQCTRLDTPDDV